MDSKPWLLNTPLARSLQGVDGFAALLQHQFQILDLDPAASPGHLPQPWALASASLAFGAVGLTSVDCVFRASLAFLPARSPAFQQLRYGLQSVEQAVLSTGAPPDPFLNLDDLILRSIAMLLFPELLHGEGPTAAQADLRRAVRELMDWMLAHLHTPLSLSAIEQRSHYGRRALKLGFKREVGMGPMQWLRQQRLWQAHQLLLDPQPGVTVSAVAQRCGYLSLASFSRDFTQRFQTTPSGLLRQARGPRR